MKKHCDPMNHEQINLAERIQSERIQALPHQQKTEKEKQDNIRSEERSAFLHGCICAARHGSLSSINISPRAAAAAAANLLKLRHG